MLSLDTHVLIGSGNVGVMELQGSFWVLKLVLSKGLMAQGMNRVLCQFVQLLHQVLSIQVVTMLMMQ